MVNKKARNVVKITFLAFYLSIIIEVRNLSPIRAKKKECPKGC
jgi:hypothetical protein